jgi:general secretion pathway protein K
MKARQRGIALLTAIILVAVAAITATAIAWQSQLSARRGIAVFTVAQSLALAEGAEAMAAYALRDSRQKNQGVVSPSQAWAKPYGPVELDAGAVLEASLEDQAGKFNLNSVVMPAGGGPGGPGGGAVPGGGGVLPATLGGVPLVQNPDAVAAFTALLEDLKIDPGFAARLVDWIDSDSQPTFPGGAEDTFYLAEQPPRRTLNMPLTSISELLALGLDRASYDRLAPFVTALPVDTKLNLCTAPGEVLDAMAGQHSYALDAQALRAQRAQFKCFPDKAAYLSSVASTRKAYVQQHVGTDSQYFRLRTWITIGTTRFTLYSLLNQDAGGQIRPVLRTFGTE